MDERLALFEAWAETYFPFAGYAHVLERVVKLSGACTTSKVLDLGTGTGNLLGQFAARGCTCWGLDFSETMLTKARAMLPEATLPPGNLRAAPPTELPMDFDVLCSAYVLHEFDDAEKVAIISRYSSWI